MSGSHSLLKALSLLLMSLLWAEGAWAAECAQTDYDLYTQAEVDALGATGCDSVSGYLIIGNGLVLTNLDGLANLTSVGGELWIWFSNVANFDGLANLTSVGGTLRITANKDLTNLDGLANLTSVGGPVVIGLNDKLTNLDGLAKITSVAGQKSDKYDFRGLVISSNDLLTDLDGLANLTSVGGNLEIYNNDSLSNCRGLATVLGWPNGPPDDTVDGTISINKNGFYYGAGCNSIDEILASLVSEPAKPSIISTDSGDGEIILEISISDNGGADITRYDASCTDGTNVYTGTSATSPITVSGLTNDVAYTCTVTATNSVGTSSASSATAPITPEEQVGSGLPIWLLYQATL